MNKKFKLGQVLICPQDGEIIKITKTKDNAMLDDLAVFLTSPYNWIILRHGSSSTDRMLKITKIINPESVYEPYPAADTPLWKLLNH